MRAAAAATQPGQLQLYEEKEIKKLSQRVSHDHYPAKGFKKRNRGPKIVTDVAVGSRRRRRKAKPLSLDQQLDLVHRAVVGCEGHSDLAKEFHVTLAVVTGVV